MTKVDRFIYSKSDTCEYIIHTEFPMMVVEASFNFGIYELNVVRSEDYNVKPEDAMVLAGLLREMGEFLIQIRKT